MLDQLAIKHNTDKSSKFHFYTKWYERYFESIRQLQLNILEIGVETGASLRMWAEYFPNARIFGIDYNLMCKQHETDRIKIFIGDQTDPNIVNWLTEQGVPAGTLDILIDDGHHTSPKQMGTFDLLWPLIKSQGLYIIEDLHCNYIQKDPMFVHCLFDVINANNLYGKSNMGNYDLAIQNLLSNEPLTELEKTVEFLHFYQHIVFIGKR